MPRKLQDIDYCYCCLSLFKIYYWIQLGNQEIICKSIGISKKSFSSFDDHMLAFLESLAIDKKFYDY